MHKTCSNLQRTVLSILLSWSAILSAAPTPALERYVVTFSAEEGEAGAIATRHGATVEKTVDAHTLVLVMPTSTAQTLARDSRVQRVAALRNGIVANAAPSDLRRYEYDAAGNITKAGDDVYTYDAVDRLTTEVVSGNERHHEYDAFGNRTGCTEVGSGVCQPGSIDETRNRIATANYDGTGNLTQYGELWYGFDAVGMQTRTGVGPNATAEYLYDANDERIATIGAGGWHWTVRDVTGKVLREFSSTISGAMHSNWRWTRDNVFRNGTLLSTVDPDGTGTRTLHYHTDHLGTPRVVSDTSGAAIGRHDYHAYGHELSGNDFEYPQNRLQFTGHERDSIDANGLDYMHARYYSASWGRFLSIDPVIDAQKILAEPQRWNRYSYVTNNPLKYDDPDGRERRILLVGTNSASEMRLQAILDETVANSQGWSYDTYDSGYSLDIRHSLGGPSLLHALGEVDNSGTDIVVINSHGGKPLQTDTGGGRDGSRKFSFGATEIANHLGGRPQAIVLAGCGTMDSAQSVANATGTVVFGIKSGAQAYASQISRAGTVLANVYAATGNAKFAIAVANRMLTKQVCPKNGGTCSGMPEFQAASPKR